LTGLCDGRVAVVTGAGRGIGRSEAIGLALEGARVVVNDLDGVTDRQDAGATTPAEEVVAEIESLGGVAVANFDDVADEQGAQRLVDQAIATFGQLDILVNNAGILRNRLLADMSTDDWDAVIRVNLRGHFLPVRAAARHWRERAERGEDVNARIINTSSGSGLLGVAEQGNYGSAKAAVATLTIVAAQEFERYGVTVNALSPHADTQMTLTLPGRAPKQPVAGWDPRDPDNLVPMVVWLASPDSRDVSGHVFDLGGGFVMIFEPWQYGPTVDIHAKWEPLALGEAVRGLLSRSKKRPPLVDPPWPT
jgi:NAD(P)-dependent dehydrogenase (short-subunit alcohol dehydrogenase family)